MLKTIFELENGEVPDRKAEGWRVKGEKKKVTRKECERLREECEDEMLYGAEWAMERRQEQDAGRQGCDAQGGRQQRI